MIHMDLWPDEAGKFILSFRNDLKSILYLLIISELRNRISFVFTSSSVDLLAFASMI